MERRVLAKKLFLFTLSDSLRQIFPLGVEPRTVGQDHGSLNLTVGDGPVLFEKAIFGFGRHQTETVLFIEPDRPSSGGPGSHQ